MVALRGVILHLLLIGQALNTAKHQQRTHRCRRVTTTKQRTDNNSPRRCECHIISERPSRLCHGLMNFLRGAVKRQVNGIPQQTIRGAGAPNEIARHINLRQHHMHARKHQIRSNNPKRNQQQKVLPVNPPRCGKQKQRQPPGKQSGNKEKSGVKNN